RRGSGSPQNKSNIRAIVQARNRRPVKGPRVRRDDDSRADDTYGYTRAKPGADLRSGHSDRGLRQSATSQPDHKTHELVVLCSQSSIFPSKGFTDEESVCVSKFGHTFSAERFFKRPYIQVIPEIHQ